MSGFQDLGGAQYSLRLLIDKFHRDAQTAQRDLRGIAQAQGEAQAALNKARGARPNNAQVDFSKELTKRHREEAAAARESNKALDEKLRRIAAGNKALQDNASIRARMVRTEATEETRANQDSARRIQQAAKSQERFSNQLAASQRRERAQGARDTARQALEQERAQGRLKDLFEGASRSGNSLLFTFRRLVGALAIFTAARSLSSGFVELVRQSLLFNAGLEDARLELGALFVAVGKVKGANGDLQKGPEAFATALTIADEQVEKLRVDALRTKSTFADLVRNFTIATGPGLRAGFDPNEIREFTVQVSQAASALNVAQSQLGEEVRSLLTGVISQRNSKIATTLGISADQIRLARAQGKLFEFIQTKLLAFNLAGVESTKTFTGLAQATSEAFQIIGGIASKGLFDNLKGLLDDVVSTLFNVERAANGAIKSIEPKPEAVAAFKTIFDFLSRGVDKLRDATGKIDFGVVAERATGFFESLGNAFDIAATALKAFIVAIRPLATALGHVIQTAASFPTLTAVFVNLRVATFVLGSALSTLVAPFFAIGKGVKVFKDLKTVLPGIAKSITTIFGAVSRASLAFLASPVGLVVAGLTIALALAATLSGAFDDFDGSLTDAASIILNGLVGGIDEFVTAVRFAASEVTEFVGSFIDPLIDFFNITLRRVIGELLVEVAAKIPSILGGDEVDKLGRDLVDQADKLDAKKRSDDQLRADQAYFNDVENISAAEQFRAQLVDDLHKRDVIRAKGVGQSMAEGVKGSGFDEALDKAQAAADDIRKKNEQKAKKATGTVTPADVEIDHKQQIELRQQQEQLALDKLHSEEQLRVNKIRAQGLPAEREANAIQRIKIETLEKEAKLQDQISRNKEIDFREENQAAIEGADGVAAEEFANDRLNAIRAEGLLKQRDITQEIRAQTVELAQNEAAQRTVVSGMQEGLRQFRNDFVEEFRLGLAVVQGTVTQFASFVSDTIVDAFDPTQDFDLQERIARFLQGLARLIAEESAKFGIAQLIPEAAKGGDAAKDVLGATTTATTLTTAGTAVAGSITGGATVAAGTLTTAGTAVGTAMTTGAAAISAAAAQLAAAATISAGAGGAGAAVAAWGGGRVGRGAVGYAGGGRVKGGTPGPAHWGFRQRKPRGLHPKDNQAVWVAINEFIHPVRSVMKYGMGFMEAIRSGSLPVEAVRALMGGSNFHPAAPAMATGMARVQSFAQGGQVGGGDGGTLRLSGGSDNLKVLPVLVESRENVDKLFSGRGREVLDADSRRSATQRGAILHRKQGVSG